MGMVPVEDSPEKPATGSQCPCYKPMLYDYFFDRKKRVWTAWEWIVPEYTHDRKMQMSEILVPTVDTLYISAMLNLMNNVGQINIQYIFAYILFFFFTCTDQTTSPLSWRTWNC